MFLTLLETLLENNKKAEELRNTLDRDCDSFVHLDPEEITGTYTLCNVKMLLQIRKTK